MNFADSSWLLAPELAFGRLPLGQPAVNPSLPPPALLWTPGGWARGRELLAAVVAPGIVSPEGPALGARGVVHQYTTAAGLRFTKDFSILLSGWFDDNSTVNQGVIVSCGSIASSKGWAVWLSNGWPTLRLGSNDVGVAQALTPGYHTLCITRVGSNISCYEDGSLQGTASLSTTLTYLADGVPVLGGYYSSGVKTDLPYLGQLSAVGVWNVALAPSIARDLSAMPSLAFAPRIADLNAWEAVQAAILISFGGAGSAALWASVTAAAAAGASGVAAASLVQAAAADAQGTAALRADAAGSATAQGATAAVADIEAVAVITQAPQSPAQAIAAGAGRSDLHQVAAADAQGAVALLASAGSTATPQGATAATAHIGAVAAITQAPQSPAQAIAAGTGRADLHQAAAADARGTVALATEILLAHRPAALAMPRASVQALGLGSLTSLAPASALHALRVTAGLQVTPAADASPLFAALASAHLSVRGPVLSVSYPAQLRSGSARRVRLDSDALPVATLTSAARRTTRLTTEALHV